MRTVRAAAGIAAGTIVCLSPAAAAAQSEASPKWDSHLDFEAKAGTKRSLGEGDLFVPLWQDNRTLVFGNLRGRFDDDSNREGNLGLGVRRMYEGGWNFGGYGYFDRRKTENGNYFDQATFGAEALGRDWDFRGNAYVPYGERVKDLGSTTTGGPATASIVGTTIQVTTPASTTTLLEERALKGFDMEVGWRVPFFEAEANRQLRIYAGGYRFSDDVAKVEGPRVRAEFTMSELNGLWSGAQLTLSAETQDDNQRGGQSFLALRLRVPLGGKAEPRKLSWQERRMAAPVVRDVDVVTQARSVVTGSTPAVIETAAATANGQAITVLSSSTTTGPTLQAALNAAGANSTVILSGSFDTGGAITTLQNGQTVMGAGSIGVRTPSGRVATLTTPAATLIGNVGTANYTVIMASNSTLTGMTINNTNPTAFENAQGVVANGVSNVRIVNNVINANFTGGASGTAHGIDVISGASNVLVSGNTLNVATTGSLSLGVQVLSASATVAGNVLSASGGSSTNATTFLNNANILPGSSGNTALAGSCSVSAPGVGATVTFTNAAACGP